MYIYIYVHIHIYTYMYIASAVHSILQLLLREHVITIMSHLEKYTSSLLTSSAFAPNSSRSYKPERSPPPTPCVSVHTRIHTHACTRTHAHGHTHTRTHTLSVLTYTNALTHEHALCSGVPYIYNEDSSIMYATENLHMCIYMYVYIYTCIYTDIYLYTHI